MKIPKAQQARRLSAAIRTAGQNLMVLVGKEHAPHFKAVPKDGNTYIVQDPLHPGVHHMTRADGSYVRLDGKYVATNADAATTVRVDVHIKGCARKVAKKAHRLASQISANVAMRRQLDTPPEISLIAMPCAVSAAIAASAPCRIWSAKVKTCNAPPTER